MDEITIPAHLLPDRYSDYQGRRSVGAVFMLRQLSNLADLVFALRYSSSGDLLTGIKIPILNKSQVNFIVRHPAIMYYLDYEVDNAVWEAENWDWGMALSVYPSSIRLYDKDAFRIRKVLIEGENLNEFYQSLSKTKYFNKQRDCLFKKYDDSKEQPITTVPHRNRDGTNLNLQSTIFDDSIYIIALLTPYDYPLLSDQEKMFLNRLRGISNYAPLRDRAIGSIKSWISKLFPGNSY